MTGHPRTYSGDHRRAIAMPLGGIGTGTIALAGDGSLRQWQIHHEPNHLACVPHSFFAVRASRPGRPPFAAVLQSRALSGDPPAEIPPTSTDHLVPLCHQRLMQQLPGIASTTFTGTYPIAQVGYHDPALPVELTLEAWSPFVPLDPDESGVPAIVFTFHAHNPTEAPIELSLLASQQNACGWDGVAASFDRSCALYGGNRNTRWESGGLQGVAMETSLPADHLRHSTMCLATSHDAATIAPVWTDIRALWQEFAETGSVRDAGIGEPSLAGTTWNSAITVPLTLDPGARQDVTFLLSWHVPNRAVNWHQWTPAQPNAGNVGVWYATRWRSAMDVASWLGDQLPRLTTAIHTVADTLHDSSMPPAIIDAVTSQISVMRTPTVIRLGNGRLYGFEGCHGFSTLHHAPPTGGCCPLNCTHVWNYEHAIARLFPTLERTMRETEWEQQYPSGEIPHRMLVPDDSLRDVSAVIGGPDKPALDGLLGAILKTYREYLAAGDDAWLDHLWPHVMRALDYLWTVADPDQAGIILGEQPNTYDISIFGANTFMGTLYLAALRSIEEMARRRNDADLAGRCHDVFLAGRAELDRRLWNGEFYIQDVDLTRFAEQNYATGCHIDHLCGQWWADALGLGDLLNPAHLTTATRAIFRHNFREAITDFGESERRLAAVGDAGTIIGTWPNGGRPEVPTRYSDEVWTGLEYELAALLLARGHVDEAVCVVSAVRDRHDGRLQNPWNDIECGDHYVRAMSSWTMLERALGMHYDAAAGELTFAPIIPGDVHGPFVTDTAWGTVRRRGRAYTISVRYGQLALNRITLDGQVVDLSGVVITPDAPWSSADA